mmetsp:Transcript_20299/g.63641  ORF Transcript_20299/g.63641 Transcript_20299/m.63641 type:complete len:254 (-) Transcript_20299:217-978(-)
MVARQVAHVSLGDPEPHLDVLWPPEVQGDLGLRAAAGRHLGLRGPHPGQQLLRLVLGDAPPQLAQASVPRTVVRVQQVVAGDRRVLGHDDTVFIVKRVGVREVTGRGIGFRKGLIPVQLLQLGTALGRLLLLKERAGGLLLLVGLPRILRIVEAHLVLPLALVKLDRVGSELLVLLLCRLHFVFELPGVHRLGRRLRRRGQLVLERLAALPCSGLRKAHAPDDLLGLLGDLLGLADGLLGLLNPALGGQKAAV